MNVSEVLRLPSFAGALLIAGTEGASCEVSSAMILEAVDIEAWGREGQLILTSFYAFKGLSDRELDEFFAKASAIGIAGIVFKPDRLLDSPGEQIISRCDELKLPLVQIPKDTKYEALMLDVLGRFLESNLILLNRFFDVHRQTMALALKSPTVLQVITELRRTIHSDITYLDAAKNSRTTTCQELSEFNSPRLTEIAPDRYRTHRYYDAELRYATIRRRATAVRIPSSDDQIYYLIIHSKSERLAPLDIMAVENVVSLLQMEVLKQNAVDRKLFFRNNNLVQDLLLDRYANRSYIDNALEILGVAQYPFYQMLLIRIDLANPSEADRREDILLAIRRRLKMIYPDIAYFQANDRIALLHNFKGEHSCFDVYAITSALKEVAEVPSMPSYTFFAALSRTGNRYELGSLNRETIDILRFFDSNRYQNACLRYEDLGVFKILMQAGDLSELDHFIDPRVAALHAARPELFRTAVTLCENSLNYQKTGRDLFVHPKTIRYRVDRLEKISELDLRNPDDRLQIVLGSRIYHLIDATE
ncbi:purine catabolism PurC domain protein [Coriobacterium glomerans PW2]|uniref:Purine catabolism PurC domain protein n=1 Tax=Coriobacterium glomerans (strain ATCC 49209 / DSM 20642 / JCM 10262 / PW2) TaxID=700015 RepID=F2N964_CORGP|nr:PucR family transcriptional regulator [Coriobacterium glomerans]AEB07740.1 purine catabolism PurC domain protein [Coriobacterium glomerans PW2]